MHVRVCVCMQQVRRFFVTMLALYIVQYWVYYLLSALYILSLYIVCVCCMKILHCDQFHMAPAHVHTQGSRVIHNHYLCNSVT